MIDDNYVRLQGQQTLFQVDQRLGGTVPGYTTVYVVDRQPRCGRFEISRDKFCPDSLVTADFCAVSGGSTNETDTKGPSLPGHYEFRAAKAQTVDANIGRFHAGPGDMQPGLRFDHHAVYVGNHTVLEILAHPGEPLGGQKQEHDDEDYQNCRRHGLASVAEVHLCIFYKSV